MTGDDSRAATDRIARLERLLASAGDGFWECELAGAGAWYSPRLCEMLGLGPDERPDEAAFFARFVHPDDAVAVRAALAQGRASAAPFAYEARYRVADGDWRWMRGRGRAWPDAGVVCGVLSDIDEQKRSQLELARLTDRLEHAVGATDAGLFERIVGEEEMHISDRLWALLGYTPGELPSRREVVIGLIHPDERERYLRETQAAVETLGRIATTMRVRCKLGHYRWFRQEGRPHRLADGRIRVVGMVADIDEQVRASEALEHQRERLERAVAERSASLEAAFAEVEQHRLEADAANAAKSRFLAHMSHELRTPLNGVIGLSDIALRAAAEPTQRRLLEVARQSGETLLRVVDDVLEVARLDEGPLQPVDAPFDLADAMAEVMRSAMAGVGAKPLHVRYDWLGTRTRVRGDASRVRQIAGHLLGNAIKFTERGHVQLIGEIVDADDGDDGAPRCRARIRIEDSGPGLPAAQAARLFDAFEQGDASLARRHGGTGVGLAVARGLAQALGGSLSLAGAGGPGAAFLLELPFGRCDDGPPAAPPAPPGLAWLLYATADAGAWMKHRIERLGWSAELLPGIEPALRRAAAADTPRPRLVLVGHSVLQRDADLAGLRAALPDAAITLLLRWQGTDPAIGTRARTLGMTPLVVPLTPRDLAATTGGAAALAEPAADAADAAGRPGGSGAPALPGSVLLVEDNPVNRLIGVQMLEALGLQVRTADDGAAALDACRERAPALVLMDIQMPVMDGLEATRRLRALQRDGALPRFPIVALSAHALDTDREQALAAGIDAYLTKPILVDALREALARWLPAKSRSR